MLESRSLRREDARASSKFATLTHGNQHTNATAPAIQQGGPHTSATWTFNDTILTFVPTKSFGDLFDLALDRVHLGLSLSRETPDFSRSCLNEMMERTVSAAGESQCNPDICR